METATAAAPADSLTPGERFGRACAGKIYWAVFTRSPGFPVVHGSHWGAGLDHADSCGGSHGHVFSTEAGARAHLAAIPSHYRGADGTPGAGRAIGWQLGRVLYCGGSSFYDVVDTAAGALAAGDTVNTAPAGRVARLERIQAIEHAGRVGGREGSGQGADVYRVTWAGAEDGAAPSLLSSRQRYDVVKLRAARQE